MFKSTLSKLFSKIILSLLVWLRASEKESIIKMNQNPSEQ